MMKRFAAALLLALGLAGGAQAESPYTRHALTVAGVEKFQAATRELEKSIKKKDDQDGDKDGMTVDELVKELDATPGVKPILARHGLTSRDYALTTLAVFEAGFHLMMEPAMDRKKGAELLKSYPAETRANIELLRKNPKLLK